MVIVSDPTCRGAGISRDQIGDDVDRRPTQLVPRPFDGPRTQHRASAVVVTSGRRTRNDAYDRFTEHERLARLQRGRPADRRTIEERAVRGAEVGDDHRTIVAAELEVASRHLGISQRQAIGLSTDDERLAQHEIQRLSTGLEHDYDRFHPR